MTTLAPRRRVDQREAPLPKALAPAWARLAVGTAAGASIAPALIDRSVHDAGPFALFLGLAGFCAALAADLDRRRPRVHVAAAIGGQYGLVPLPLGVPIEGAASAVLLLLLPL